MSQLNVEPSEAELEILRIMWREQPCTVKTVHEAITREREVGYTTVLKQMQRLTEKGLVERLPGSGKAHRFRATHAPDAMRGRVLGRVLKGAFGNSTGDLVMHALGSKKPTASEIVQIRAFLDKLEGKDDA